MLKKPEKNALRPLISLTVFFLVLGCAMFGYAVVDEPTKDTKGKVPSVEAIETEKQVTPLFRVADDGPVLSADGGRP